MSKGHYGVIPGSISIYLVHVCGRAAFLNAKYQVYILLSSQYIQALQALQLCFSVKTSWISYVTRACFPVFYILWSTKPLVLHTKDIFLKNS